MSYFTENGGSNSKNLQYRGNKVIQKQLETLTGLEEIVAETMYIKSYPNEKESLLALRTHFLMMNFPRTIAKAATLLEENWYQAIC